MNAKKLTELAMLTGLALIIFVVELQIPSPLPIPGVKLGLANIITVFSLYHYRSAEALTILVARIVLGAIFGGNIMTLMYSLAGGLLCLTGMVLFKKIIPMKHLWFCSVIGAILHNIGQVAVACVVAGRGMLLYFPVLLVSGCLAGAFTGGCAQLIIHKKELQNIL